MKYSIVLLLLSRAREFKADFHSLQNEWVGGQKYNANDVMYMRVCKELSGDKKEKKEKRER